MDQAGLLWSCLWYMPPAFCLAVLITIQVCTYSQASSAGSQRLSGLILRAFSSVAVLILSAIVAAVLVPVESAADPLHLNAALAEGIALPKAEKVELSASANGNRRMPLRTVVKVTGYSSTPDQTDSTPFITAANTKVREGVVASNYLPFGTRVMFPDLFGEKVFVVEDRLHPKNSHKIDIWFPSREAATAFGIRETVMEVFSPNDKMPSHDSELVSQAQPEILSF